MRGDKRTVFFDSLTNEARALRMHRGSGAFFLFYHIRPGFPIPQNGPFVENDKVFYKAAANFAQLCLTSAPCESKITGGIVCCPGLAPAAWLYTGIGPVVYRNLRPHGRFL